MLIFVTLLHYDKPRRTTDARSVGLKLKCVAIAPSLVVFRAIFLQLMCNDDDDDDDDVTSVHYLINHFLQFIAIYCGCRWVTVPVGGTAASALTASTSGDSVTFAPPQLTLLIGMESISRVHWNLSCRPCRTGLVDGKIGVRTDGRTDEIGRCMESE